MSSFAAILSHVRLIAGGSHAVEAELSIADGFLEGMGAGAVEELADGQPMLQIGRGFDPIACSWIAVGREAEPPVLAGARTGD